MSTISRQVVGKVSFESHPHGSPVWRVVATLLTDFATQVENMYEKNTKPRHRLTARVIPERVVYPIALTDIFLKGLSSTLVQ